MSDRVAAPITAELKRMLLSLSFAAFDDLMRQVISSSGYAPVVPSGRRYRRGRTAHGGLDMRAYTRTDLASGLTLVQIKQYERVVSRRFVDEMRGAMLRNGAERGLLLTVSTFSRVARSAAASSDIAAIELLDGDAVAELLIRQGHGVREDVLGQLQLDREFFDILQKKWLCTGEPPKARREKVSLPFEPINSISANRASRAIGGDMQWRTHVLIGLNSLWILEALPGAARPGQLPLLLGAAAFGSLLPDLDAAQSKIKHLGAWGIKPFYLPSVAIFRAFGHRGFLHSASALAAVAVASIPLGRYFGWQVGAALTLGYAAHLAADACTRSGIPFGYVPYLHPDRRRGHLLPPSLRFVTGSEAEAALLPFLALLAMLLLLRHLPVNASPGEEPVPPHVSGRSDF